MLHVVNIHVFFSEKRARESPSFWGIVENTDSVSYLFVDGVPFV